jgi:hypothetical protein
MMGKEHSNHDTWDRNTFSYTKRNAIVTGNFQGSVIEIYRQLRPFQISFSTRRLLSGDAP